MRRARTGRRFRDWLSRFAFESPALHMAAHIQSRRHPASGTGCRRIAFVCLPRTPGTCKQLYGRPVPDMDNASMPRHAMIQMTPSRFAASATMVYLLRMLMHVASREALRLNAQRGRARRSGSPRIINARPQLEGLVPCAIRLSSASRRPGAGVGKWPAHLTVRGAWFSFSPEYSVICLVSWGTKTRARRTQHAAYTPPRAWELPHSRRGLSPARFCVRAWGSPRNSPQQLQRG